MRINVINQKDSKNLPSFKHEVFTSLKNLPGMTCAICGKPTLSNDLYLNTIKSLSRPLIHNMDKGHLNFAKNNFPKAWDKLTELAQCFPELTLDEILINKPEVREELGHVINSSFDIDFDSLDKFEARTAQRKIQDTYFYIQDAARSEMRQSSVVIRELSKLKKYLDDIKAEVFEQFEIYARKYPKKHLAEIVKTPEIYQFHSVKNFLDKMEKREKLDFRFQNIVEIIKPKKSEDKEFVNSLKDKVLSMYEIERTKLARDYYAKEIYSNALKELGCSALESRVFKELDEIPKTFISKDSFFYQAKNCNYNDSKIVASLFGPYLASEEHVNARSVGGEDVVGNKIVAHRNCNSNRAAKPYSEILQFHPDMPENAQKQIDLIVENLRNNNLPERLKVYPIYIANTLREASDGLIKLDIDKYCKDLLQVSDNKILENEKIISDLRAQKNKIDLCLEKMKKENSMDLSTNRKIRAYLESQK